MKRILLVLQSCFFALATFAQFAGDGYYRVKNVASERYITVCDNRGSVNVATTSADMGAVELYKGFDNVVADPGSILYIDETASGFKFHSQGTDTYEIIGYYLKLSKNSDGSYKAYQGNSMMVMYLGDSETTSVVDGKLSTNAKGKYRDWYILPVTSSSTDNYFGLKPEVKAADGYYASFYASFPFTVVSKATKVYYIDKVDNGMAVYKEITDGVVPAAAPVFVKCVSENPVDNKLDIAANDAAISGNKLSGVYFNNDNKAHLNRTAYDPETMRVLGTDADGKLAYIKVDYDYLPANRSYLTVPAGSPDVVKVVSEQEYQAIQESLKSYTVTFVIDGEVISSQTLKAGDAITVPEAPEKEGYTFVGWGDVPATMPASDVTYTGSYKVNSYSLIYMVDGKEYQRQTQEYGTTITLLANPAKEERKFSGWSEAPVTMPAGDVTVEGAFMYMIRYYVDEALVYTEEVFYGDFIPEYVYQPTEEGLTFLGWIGDSYKVMPAYDITYTANIVSSVELITADTFVDVYTITGAKVMSRVSLGEAKRALKRGIYIVNGKKMIIE